MPAPQNFRTAFNGFRREDVVRYLEYINAKHTAEINQLTSEADYLRSRLENAEPAQNENISELEAERDALKAQLEEMTARCAELEAKLAEKPETVHTTEDELEAYRRAELVFHQINGVLAEATAKVDGVASEVGGMADQVMSQLTQLQVAVGNSKKALKDAAATMYAIRPNE